MIGRLEGGGWQVGIRIWCEHAIGMAARGEWRVGGGVKGTSANMCMQ